MIAQQKHNSTMTLSGLSSISRLDCDPKTEP